MKAYTAPTLVALVAALLLLFIFGPQSQRVNLEQYEQMTTVLMQLKDQDVRMNEHMLLAGSGMLRNFDSMVHITNSLNALQTQLIELEAGMSGDARLAVEVGTHELFVQLKQKISFLL